MSKQISRLDRGQCFTAVQFPSVGVLLYVIHHILDVEQSRIIYYDIQANSTAHCYLFRVPCLYTVRGRIIPDCHQDNIL